MTVAEVIAELSKLPGHLPVASTIYVDIPGEDEEPYEATINREVGEVRYEGRFVALECDGPYL